MKNNSKQNIFRKILLFKLPYYWLPIIISASFLIFSLLGYLGKYSWFCDLFAHFKVQYFLISLCCSFALLCFAKFAKKLKVAEFEEIPRNNFPLSRKRLHLISLFSCVVPLINLFEIAPFYMPEKPITKSSKLRLMHVNVHTANTRYQDVQQYVLKQDPDILLLEEVSHEWIKNMPEIIKKYPYSTIYPQSDNFGIAMFAKINPVQSKTLLFGEYGLPYIKAEFQINNKKLTFFGVHTIPPVGKLRYQERNRMLKEIAQWIKGLEKSSVIILGDLNVTPWSYHFKNLIKEGNLRNSQTGFGVQLSWPDQPFLLRIPIDHCLVSKNISVTNRFIGPDVGSDHFPVVIDILVP